MTTPANRNHIYANRLLLIIAAVCFFLAAITACGQPIFNAPALAWAFGAFAAWCLAGAV